MVGEAMNDEIAGRYRIGQAYDIRDVDLLWSHYPKIRKPIARSAIKDRIPGVSLIIPAYNEADRICKSIDAYVPVLSAIGMPFEIVVIIDGKDDTRQVVDAYGNGNIRCHTFQGKLGRGGAILKGFQVSRYSIVGYTDADGSLSSKDIPKLVELCNSYDCVIGSRWLNQSRWIHKEPRFNSIAGRVFNLLIRGILGVPVSDTEGGGKFFRGEVLDSVLSKVSVTNRAFTASLFYHLQSDGYSITEAPITWDHDGNTRMPISKAIPVMLFTLLGIRLMNLPISRMVPKTVVDFFHRRFSTV
jgi:glycosyltransferase involved in cell wall biosynthesis